MPHPALRRVTSFLATSGADTIPEIKRCIAAADEAYEAGYPGAEMLGVHLEGPFINPQYRGMQREECCIAPSLEMMEELYGSFRHPQLCRHMTIAVEREGAGEVLFILPEPRNPDRGGPQRGHL